MEKQSSKATEGEMRGRESKKRTSDSRTLARVYVCVCVCCACLFICGLGQCHVYY